MPLFLNSSVPRISPAMQWDLVQAGETAGLVLHKDVAGGVDVGIRRQLPGVIQLNMQEDELCHLFRGAAVFSGNNGETIEATPETVIHLKNGWAGQCHVSETIDVAYMRCPGAKSDHTPVLRNPKTIAPLKEWGAIATMVEGISKTAGVLLSRDPDGRAESGVWTCTPGTWRCEVTSGEFCHFLAGSCTYVHDNGETIEIQPDTVAFFSRGWSGRCTVRETVRKVYMIR
jgi:uncharacterized cupin superfamily protein